MYSVLFDVGILFTLVCVPISSLPSSTRDYQAVVGNGHYFRKKLSIWIGLQYRNLLCIFCIRAKIYC